MEDRNNTFNEFEEYFINTALTEAARIAEEDILTVERTGEGVRSIFASGYFTMVSEERKRKISRMTRKEKESKQYI
jgi:demethoxyubiquinone hydroxylase (CLK1/Coq7/Cat5 family)